MSQSPFFKIISRKFQTLKYHYENIQMTFFWPQVPVELKQKACLSDNPLTLQTRADNMLLFHAVVVISSCCSAHSNTAR